MHISGDHSNYVVEIDTSKIPGRVIPIVNQKDWKALVPDLEMLTEEARNNFHEAMQKSNKKQEYLVLYRGLLDPTMFKVLPRPIYAAEGRQMPVMFDEAIPLWFQSVWDLIESNLQSAREFLTPEICCPKLQIPGDSVQDFREKLYSPDSKTRSSASTSGQDSFALQQSKRLKTKDWKSLRSAHSQTPSTAHSQTPSQALPRQLADQEGSVEVKEWKAPNMEKAQMTIEETMVDKEHPLEQLMPAKVEDQEQQQSKQQQKNEASAQKAVHAKNTKDQWWTQQLEKRKEELEKRKEEEQEQQQKKHQKETEEQEMTQKQDVKSSKRLDMKEEIRKLKESVDRHEQEAGKWLDFTVRKMERAKKAAEQEAAKEEQLWQEVVEWLSCHGFLKTELLGITPRQYQDSHERFYIKKDLLDHEGFTPLQRACKVACNEGVEQGTELGRVLEYLISGSQPGHRAGELDACTPVCKGTRPPGWAPIHLLAEAKGAAFLVKKLIDAKADVAQDTKTKKSNALFKACPGGNLEIVILLIGTNKFDKFDRTWNNMSYVDVCAKSSGDVRRVLESWGAERDNVSGKSGREMDPEHARGASGYPNSKSRQKRACYWHQKHPKTRSLSKRITLRSVSPRMRRSESPRKRKAHCHHKAPVKTESLYQEST